MGFKKRAHDYLQKASMGTSKNNLISSLYSFNWKGWWSTQNLKAHAQIQQKYSVRSRTFKISSNFCFNSNNFLFTVFCMSTFNRTQTLPKIKITFFHPFLRFPQNVNAYIGNKSTEISPLLSITYAIVHSLVIHASRFIRKFDHFGKEEEEEEKG